MKTLKLNLNDQLTYETVKGVPSTTFPAYAFRGTVKLVSVELDGFTALGTGAFIGQNYMTSIRIPNVEEMSGIRIPVMYRIKECGSSECEEDQRFCI